MAIILLGHQPIDFTYKENDPCEVLSDMCLQYEVGDNPMFQIKNTETTAPIVSIQGIGNTSFEAVVLTPVISEGFYTYTVNFAALGITSGCYELCVYEVGSAGTNLVTNGEFTSDLSGWTAADALMLDIDSLTKPTSGPATDGEVVLVATGGTGPYTYSINGVSYQVSTTFTGLSYGVDYTFYVKDANGIIDSIDFSFVNCADYGGSYAFDIKNLYAFDIKDCEAHDLV
jgi:hypothetical protein